MAKKEKKIQVHDKESSSSEIVRRFKANPALFIGTVVVLVLVIVSFVLVPAIVPESTRGNASYTFGYYDKVPISWAPGNYFSQQVEQITQHYRSSMDTNDFQVGMIIWRQAFEAAAVHTAVLQELNKSNYSVPEKTVDRQVAQLPNFQENGRFSPALYRQVSDSERLSLWRRIRDEIAKMQYYNDLFSLLVSSSEADFIGDMSSNMRSFDIISFSVDDYPDSEYLTYAQEHSELFRAIHLSRISVNSSEREARKILASINDGTSTFEDAARSQSQDSYADRGGDMGIRYSFELEREITGADDREKVFSLGRGDLSDVMRIDERWVFFRVEDELKTADFNDEAVMDRVRSYIRNFERGRMEDWAIARAEEFKSEAEASGFDDAVRWLGKEKHSFGPLPINYGNVDLFTSLDSFSIPELSSSELSDMSRNENFWRTAFSTPIGTTSLPFVQGSKVLVLLPTEQVYADEEKIEEISSMYSSYWLSYVTEQTHYPYFINSSKMDNRFWDTYYNLFMPSNF